MSLSQKCQYAVRAVLALAQRQGQGPISAGEIAASYDMPQRFLEVILNELKPSGLVGSRRGVGGGYQLTVAPSGVTVGQIIRLIDGPLGPVSASGDPGDTSSGGLAELWAGAKRAIEGVYEGTTFQDLADRQRMIDAGDTPDYCI